MVNELAEKEEKKRIEKKPSTKIPKEKKTKKKPKSIPPVIIITLAILGFLFLVYSNWDFQGWTNITKAEVKLPIETAKLSFADYIINSYKYYNKEVTLTGFLQRDIERVGTGGVYVEYIADDFGNKINLVNLKKVHLDLFLKVGRTNELYNVTGIFKSNHEGLHLEVSDIAKAERN